MARLPGAAEIAVVGLYHMPVLPRARTGRFRRKKKQGQKNMDYIKHINETLRPKETELPVVLDLFAGCGGLSLGFEAAGYKTVGCELLESACETYNRNLSGVCHCARLEVGFEYEGCGEADIVMGGPPCQPFSVHGKQMGMQDARDVFPVFIDAVRRIRQKVFMFENVRKPCILPPVVS